MALKVDYVMKETATNLRRNITLTFATIITIAVTLAMAGAVLLIGKGLGRSEGRFRGNIEFIVFMEPKASQDQVDSVGRALTESPQVKSNRYLDHDAAFAEFKDLFRDQPELVNNITPDVLPTNYKVQVKDGRSEVVQSLVDEFDKEPGVLEVVAAPERIKKQEKSFGVMRWIALIGGGVVGAASLVLIVNSIRTAMFARRREIEVMKLVGATNWFIQVPFMLEGMVQGIFGAAMGCASVWAAKIWLLPALQQLGGLFANFELRNGDVWQATIWLMVAGVFVGMAASFFATMRYLEV
jgi:cell division transport system permease protein